jgi:hypothetical protein
MADFLSEKRTEIERRLKEIRPLHEEYLKLERAKSALDGLEAPTRRRGTGRPRGSTTRTRRRSTGRRRGRPRGSGRAAEALQLVRQNPGITVAELADQMRMNQRNYLYRIMSNLQSEGAVRKQGRGFHAR